MTRTTGITLLLALSVAGATALDWKNLHLTFGAFDGMFSIPFTLTELLKEDYTLMVTDPDLKVDFYAYKKDPRVTIGFDTQGSIAGVRIAYIKADIATKAKSKGLTFDLGYYNDDPMYSNGTFFDTEVYYNTILFNNPEALRAGGRSGPVDVVGENVYVKLKGVWTVLPKNECDAPSQGYTKEACFPMMGKHYFYGVSSTMDCKDFNGLFTMYEGGKMVGLGITIFGSHTNAASRTWYEGPSSGVYKVMLPNDSPKCLTEWVDNFGATSLHFFFKKHPRLTFCLERETKCA